MWEAIKYVSSSLTLVAFIVAAVVVVLREQILQKERLIRSAPRQDRIKLIGAILEVFNVDTRNLSREQQFDVAMAQIQARARRFTQIITTIVILACLTASVAVYAISKTRVDEKLAEKIAQAVYEKWKQTEARDFESAVRQAAQAFHVTQEQAELSVRKWVTEEAPQGNQIAEQLKARLKQLDRNKIDAGATINTVKIQLARGVPENLKPIAAEAKLENHGQIVSQAAVEIFFYPRGATGSYSFYVLIDDNRSRPGTAVNLHELGRNFRCRLIQPHFESEGVLADGILEIWEESVPEMTSASPLRVPLVRAARGPLGPLMADVKLDDKGVISNGSAEVFFYDSENPNGKSRPLVIDNVAGSPLTSPVNLAFGQFRARLLRPVLANWDKNTLEVAILELWKE